MSSPDVHPSRLQLDRLALSPDATQEAAAHVAQCGECARYVSRARSECAELAASSTPAWVRALPRWGARRAPLRLGLSLVAAAAVVLVVRTALPGANDVYVGAKGAPSIALYVRSDGDAVPWDYAPLAPGAAIRVEAQPGEHTHLTLFEVEGTKLIELDDRELVPHSVNLLPRAWELDDKAPSVTLVAVFSRAPLSAADRKRVQSGSVPPGSYVKRLAIPMQSSANGRP